MFADDLKAAGDSTTPEAVAFVPSDLDAISQWAAANELLISLPKCCTLHYGARSSRHQYILGGQPVASVSECVDLGVLRSDCFSYQSLVRAAALKAARLAGMVMRMFASREKRFRCKLFCAYVRPLAEYAAPVWSPDDVMSSVLLENNYTAQVYKAHRWDVAPIIRRALTAAPTTESAAKAQSV